MEGDAQALLRDLIDRVGGIPRSKCSAATPWSTDFEGSGQLHRRSPMTGRQAPQEIEHGVTIVATGATEERRLRLPLREDPRVLTQLELASGCPDDGPAVADGKSVVMIQCVGPGTRPPSLCAAASAARRPSRMPSKLKGLNPETTPSSFCPRHPHVRIPGGATTPRPEERGSSSSGTMIDKRPKCPQGAGNAYG